jgi:hypothetical protein
MKTLRDIQERLQAYILKQDAGIISEVVAADKTIATQRLEIYHDAYYLRLLEVLEKDFPCLKNCMGDQLFEKTGREYIDAHTSNHFSICYFNRFFSDFLTSMGLEPYYAEMAHFEWALLRALDAPDAYQISVDDLATITPETWPYIQFNLHPSVKLYFFHYNVSQICYSIMFDQEKPALVYQDNIEHCLIWRFNQQSYFETLNPQRIWMVDAIQKEKTFAEICEGLCEWLPEEEIAQFAAATLRHWIEKGVFSEIKVADSVAAIAEDDALDITSE